MTLTNQTNIFSATGTKAIIPKGSALNKYSNPSLRLKI